MELHPAQENFRGFTYFLFSLYSTVLKTFFWDSGVVTVPAERKEENRADGGDGARKRRGRTRTKLG